MRCVPASLDFTNRPIREESRIQDLSGYKPSTELSLPSSLQHTKTECTWDTEGGGGKGGGGRFSQWRDLNESELQQYIASDTDTDTDDEVAVSRRDKMRKLLLGDGDDDEGEGEGGDPFFQEEVEVEVENQGGKSITFIPREQPQEDDHDGKKKKKDKKKRKKEDNSLPQKEVVQEEEQRSRAHLELLFDEDSQQQREDDYDMVQLVKQEKKNKRKKKKGVLGEGGEENNSVAADDFHIDFSDNRFQPLFTGDAKFGVDPLSSEFKDTKHMQQILQKQRTDNSSKHNRNGGSAGGHGIEVLSRVDVSELANRLKRKFK